MNIEKDVYNCWTCIAPKRTFGKTLTGLLAGRVTQDELEEYISSLDDFRVSARAKAHPVEEKRPQLPPEYRPLYLSSDDGKYRKYLVDRGVTDDDILFHRIGFCDSGSMAGRVVFPSFDESGELNYYTCRKISDRIPGPRYITCDSSKDIIFNDCLIDWDLPVIIVEGPFDMLAVGRNAIPLQGKMLRPSYKLFQKIVRRSPRVYVCLDPDARGDQIAILHLLFKYCTNVYDVRLDGYKDIADMPRESVFGLISSSCRYNMLSRARALCE